MRHDANGATRRGMFAAGGLLLLAAVLVGGSVFLLTRWLEDAGLLRRIEIDAQETLAVARAEVSNGRARLSALRALFDSSEVVESNEFDRFTEEVMDGPADADSAAWAPIVDAADRAAFSSGQVPILERSAEGALVLAGARDRYAPLLFRSGGSVEIAASGEDLRTIDAFGPAIDAAIASGETRVALLDGGPAGRVAIEFYPVYRTRVPPGTRAERVAAVDGVVVGSFLLETFLDAVRARAESRGLCLAVLDRRGTGAVLAETAPASARTDGHAWSSDDAPTVRLPLSIGSQEWELAARPKDGYLEQRRSLLAWVLAAVSALATALLVRLMIVRRAHARQLGRANERLSHEIRERRGMELRANESRERLAKIVDAAIDAIVTFDQEGKVTLFNPAAAAVFRCSAQDALGRSILDFFPPSARRENAEFMRAALSGSAELGSRGCTLLRRMDGEEFQGELAMARLELVDGPAVTLTVHDLSERLAAEAERDRIQGQLLSAQKYESIALLAGGIAHDFNNLLTAISGNAELAADQMRAHPEAREHLEQVVKGTRQAALLTRQLLAYAGRGRLAPVLLDVSREVRETASLLEAALPRGVRLVLELSDDVPAVEADAAQFHQLLMNLVINAAEACGDKGEVRVASRLAPYDPEDESDCSTGVDLEERDYVVLEVSDTGCGMEAMTRSRLFEPFFTTKFAGRGLGLAAVSGIVRSHGGRLVVHSAPGEGSRFRLYLPTSGRASPRDAPRAAPEPSPGGRVMVVDDESLVRDVLARMLRRERFEVVAVGSGRAALERFESGGERFQAIVVDLTMPEISGPELLRIVRKRDADIAVVLISGFGQDESVQSLLRDGRTIFLHKPFTADQLLAALRRVMTRNLARS